jgi:very-short-patch-repair endonuclease
MPYAKRGTPDFLPLKRRLRSQMTPAEVRLWSALRLRQFHRLKFRRQHGIGPYIVDFYCPARSLVIEVDGDTHAEAAQIAADRERDTYLQSLGVRVVRYTNDDVLHNLDGVIEDLRRKTAVDSTSPHPSLQRRGNA